MGVRVVIDTNVLVSSLVSAEGAPRQLLDGWLDNRFTLVTSLYLIEELIHVLTYPRIAQRLCVAEEELITILTALRTCAHIVPGKLELPGVTRDPKDDWLIACAVEGEADYIVSGDEDLLALGEYGSIRIVTPRQFVDML